MLHDTSYNCLVICGPTATGKTKIGTTSSRRYGGEIISADSRQVYRGMDLGTGKDLGEYAEGGSEVLHHCIDIADPSDLYTLYDYMRDFNRSFEGIVRRSRLPVIVGGSGLYVEGALRQYRVSRVPEHPEFRSEMMLLEKDHLAVMLEKEDGELFARTDCSSKKRIVRALEVSRFSEAYGDDPFVPLEIRPLICGVLLNREEIIRRIDVRLDQRLSDGMIEEVAGLLAQGITRERMQMFGMEYGMIARYLGGEISLQEMRGMLACEIHRLAKRQMTWFRGMERRGSAIRWIRNAEELFTISDTCFLLKPDDPGNP